jgi:hypothetical protein
MHTERKTSILVSISVCKLSLAAQQFVLRHSNTASELSNVTH